MAEEITMEQILASMPEDERRQFLSSAMYANNMKRLNNNQLTISGLPDVDQPYSFEKPEGLGGALKNISKNLFRPQMERLGLKPSIKGQVANMQYQQFLRGNAEIDRDLIRDDMGRNYLLQRGVNARQVQAMSGEELRETVQNVVGVNKRDRFGNSYQMKLGTGERISGQKVSPEMQQYLFDNPDVLNPPTPNEGTEGLTEDQKKVVENIPSFSEYERRNEAFSDTNKLAAKSNDERGKEYVKLSQDAYGQQNSLKHMISLTENPEFESGTGTEFLTYIQSLGYNLGITSESPELEEVFQALSRAIIIPMVKSLGVNPTDKDFEIIESASAGLGQTRAGNLILLRARQISNQRKVQVSEAYQKFSDENFDMKAGQPLRFEAKWDIELSKIQKSAEWQGPLLSELNNQARDLSGTTPDISFGNLVQDQFAGPELQ